MSSYEVTYLAHTGRPPERIQAVAHTVDDSTTPPTHRFEVRGRIMSTRFIKRTDVEAVREIQSTAGAEAVPENPLPPFVRQVSNREFPQGRRPDSS